MEYYCVEKNEALFLFRCFDNDNVNVLARKPLSMLTFLFTYIQKIISVIIKYKFHIEILVFNTPNFQTFSWVCRFTQVSPSCVTVFFHSYWMSRNKNLFSLMTIGAFTSGICLVYVFSYRNVLRIDGHLTQESCCLHPVQSQSHIQPHGSRLAVWTYEKNGKRNVSVMRSVVWSSCQTFEIP